MLRKECLKAPTATKLSIPDTHVVAKKQMRGGRRLYRLKYLWFTMVGAEGFDPLALCSQSRSSDLLKPVEMWKKYLTSIEQYGAYQSASVDLCGSLVL